MSAVGEKPLSDARAHSASREEGSCCGRAYRWINENRLLIVVNLVLLAAIVTTASLNLSSDMKLIICFSAGGALLLLNGVYYWRNRSTEMVVDVPPFRLQQDFHALLQKVGYTGTDKLPIIKEGEQRKVNIDISPAIYLVPNNPYLSTVNQARGEVIYLPRHNIILVYYPDTPSGASIYAYNCYTRTVVLIVGVKHINNQPDHETVKELAAMIARAQEVRK